MTYRTINHFENAENVQSSKNNENIGWSKIMSMLKMDKI